MNIITYEDFAKVELMSGTIIKVEDFLKARKPAYKIWADFGDDIGIKQTSAQVTFHYSTEELMGRQIVGCVNLEPKNIAGFISEFLLVGFPDIDNNVCLICADPKAPDGKKLF